MRRFKLPPIEFKMPKAFMDRRIQLFSSIIQSMISNPATLEAFSDQNGDILWEDLAEEAKEATEIALQVLSSKEEQEDEEDEEDNE